MLHVSDPLTLHADGRSYVQQEKLHKNLPELLELERILSSQSQFVSKFVYQTLEADGVEFPIYGVQIGKHIKDQPRLLLVGGIYGVERIGSRILIALLRTWLQRLRWDNTLENTLESTSITVIPIVNPVGMYRNTRSNINSVDLMRNAPIEAKDKATFLLGGQRLSKRLSWYRGANGLEPENQILENVVEYLSADTKLLISLDCHSGFGLHDRIWFPYAYRRSPMKGIAPVMALKSLWENSYPYHNYIFEPQSNHYLTHGDMWDYCYKKYTNRHPDLNFIPLTLELGSWRWVRKRPSQLLSFEGLFNPLTLHRLERALRSHLPFLDFLLSSTVSYKNWLPNPDEAEQFKQLAQDLWYKNS